MSRTTERLLQMYLRWQLAPIRFALGLSLVIGSVLFAGGLIGVLWGLWQQIWQ